jgi:hypothetical protein
VTGALDGARRDWEDGYRRFELERRVEPTGERLQLQFDVVSGELRRRVGGTFTLAELAAVYATSDGWIRQAIEEYAATPQWVRSVATVGDAAFHVYARGALDYRP